MARFEKARFKNLSARSRVLPAVTVAGSVLLFTVVVKMFMSMLYFVMSLLQRQDFQPGVFGLFLNPTFLAVVLAFCVGVFAWLWLFAPVTAELHLRNVLGSSVLAVVSGTVLAFIVMFGIQMQVWFANANFFSNSLGQASESFLRDGANAFSVAVTSTAQLAVNALPVTVLAVLLMWLWAMRHSAHGVEAFAQAEV